MVVFIKRCSTIIGVVFFIFCMLVSGYRVVQQRGGISQEGKEKKCMEMSGKTMNLLVSPMVLFYTAHFKYNYGGIKPHLLSTYKLCAFLFIFKIIFDFIFMFARLEKLK